MRISALAVLVVIFAIPISCPFPHVAEHVIQGPGIGSLEANWMKAIFVGR